MTHCSDNGSDRELGKRWEVEFCKMAGELGYSFTPLQLYRTRAAQAYLRREKWRHFTLPDVAVWTYPGQHHEIKHKAPTKSGWFGLEKYRFAALLWYANETRQQVMYTIHNHALSGGRDAIENDLAHWLTADVHDLNRRWIEGEFFAASWIDGQKQDRVPIYYWPAGLWMPLADYWQGKRESAEVVQLPMEMDSEPLQEQ